MNGNQKDKPEQRDYRSYLLRLWRVKVKAQTIWRASLECPHTGERLGFANLEALYRYLRVETEQDLTVCVWNGVCHNKSPKERRSK